MPSGIFDDDGGAVLDILEGCDSIFEGEGDLRLELRIKGEPVFPPSGVCRQRQLEIVRILDLWPEPRLKPPVA